ncbi:MAG: hypothetical protein JWN63_2843 [Candidatus Acidoferrum typicum]|nr:hypothetical protein [Candidatus Acidoferrum typicum]
MSTPTHIGEAGIFRLDLFSFRPSYAIPCRPPGAGNQVREKSHRRSDFFVRAVLAGCVFTEFPIPLEHPRVTHPAFDDPEQLIVRLARRMQRNTGGLG